jgi:hypothetical protein
MYNIPKEDIAKYIQNREVIFTIKKADIQEIALKVLDRKLNNSEMISVCNAIINNFMTWEDLITEILSTQNK